MTSPRCRLLSPLGAMKHLWRHRRLAATKAAEPATSEDTTANNNDTEEDEQEEEIMAPSQPQESSFLSEEPVVNQEEYPGLKEVESADIPEPEKPFLHQLLLRMNPLHCMPTNLPEVIDSCGVIAYKSCVAGATEEFEWLLPGILNEIENGSTKTRSAALQRLYRLVDRDHKSNRVAAVCSTKFSTIDALSSCLYLETPAADRRQALLILNNLCIPNENKAVILFGNSTVTLLSALMLLIRSRTPECYLAIVTLVNLSYIADEQAKAMLLHFSPTSPSRVQSLSGQSLLRTLEHVLGDCVPYLHTPVQSVEQQCCRWSMNALRNLATVQNNAVIMTTETRIPEYAVQCLLYGDVKRLREWTRDSLEDAALMLLVHAAKDDDCLVTMRQNTKLRQDIDTVCGKLSSEGKGIHRTRAIALKERFDEDLAEQSATGYSV